MLILNTIVSTPASVYNEYNKMILTREYKDIDKNFIFKKKMCRYILALSFALLLHLTSWYYVTVFCSVYTKSSVSWISGGIISLFIKFCIVQPILPFVKALFRWVTYKYPNK